jgi:hypothetical protein
MFRLDVDFRGGSIFYLDFFLYRVFFVGIFLGLDLEGLRNKDFLNKGFFIGLGEVGFFWDWIWKGISE